MNIAYWTLGEGPPLLYSAALSESHASVVWEIPRIRRMFEQPTRKRTVVYFDPRGSGLSDRHPKDDSFVGMLADFSAVADACGAGTFDLIGPQNTDRV